MLMLFVRTRKVPDKANKYSKQIEKIDINEM